MLMVKVLGVKHISGTVCGQKVETKGGGGGMKMMIWMRGFIPD